MSGITLVMMVRDEELTIGDTLRSWLKVANNVVICDTGSLDQTRQLAARVCLDWFAQQEGKRKNLRAYEEHWHDFSTNRNRCLERASLEFPGHWNIMVDADTRLHGASQLDSFLMSADPSQVDSFEIETRLGNLCYPMRRVFYAGSNWRYVGHVHEAPVRTATWCSVGGRTQNVNPPPGGLIPGCWQEYVGTDAGTERKRRAWEGHLDLLARERLEQGETRRNEYYTAQTYECLGDLDNAAVWYGERFTRLGGYEPERWRAGLQLARIYMQRQKEAAAVQILTGLSELRPWRAEPWYELARCRMAQLDLDRALAYARIAAHQDVPDPKLDAYMLELDVYSYRAMLLVAQAQEARGDKTGAEAAYWILDRTSCLPEADRLFVNQRLAVLRSGSRS